MFFSQKSSGFTLTELMVTMSIFTLLITALYRGTNNTFEQRNSIREEITTIQTMFSNARNMAITSTGVNASDDDGNTTEVVSQYGYGVHMSVYGNASDNSANNTVFTLFADTNFDSSTNSYGDGDFDEDANGDGIQDSTEDVILVQYSAFEKGAARGVNTKVEFITPEGNIKVDTVDKASANHELTILFAPLNANPTILFNNDPGNNEYQGVIINFLALSLIEEELLFHSISRFFERNRICPANGATPSDCSTPSTL